MKFYTLCGGGEFGFDYRFISPSEIESETRNWVHMLKDYDSRGDVLTMGRPMIQPVPLGMGFANGKVETGKRQHLNPWIIYSRIYLI